MADWKPMARLFDALGLPAAGAYLQSLTERKLLIEGVVILLVVILLPKGLSGLRLPRRQRPRPAETPPPAKAEAPPHG
jgi:hypothetical protein